MPIAFPSHQGLILPLWRRYPRALDGVAISVGAAMPDIVDFAAWPFRGTLGQWMGHSLLGLAVCTLLGLPLTRLTRAVLPPRWTARLDRGAPASPSAARAALSLFIGALSHDLFDLITHENFLLLWPWFQNAKVFPEWWCRRWASVPLLVYAEPYPLAPHTIVWALLSIVGIFLFVRSVRARD